MATENTPLTKEFALNVNSSEEEYEDELYLKPHVARDIAGAPSRSGTLLNALWNFTNAPMGASVLSLPYAFYCSGLVSGVIIVFIVYFLTLLSLGLILDLSFPKNNPSIRGFRTYQDLIHHYLGPIAKKLCALTLVIDITGVCIAFSVLLGQFFSPLLGLVVGDDSFWSKSSIMMLYFAVLFIFPLCLLRSIKKLSFTSFISVGVQYGLCCFIVSYGIVSVISKPESKKNLPYIVQTHSLGRGGFTIPMLFLAIPIICYSYTQQQLCNPIAYEIDFKKKNFKTKLFVTVFTAQTAVLVMYLFIGIFGFLAFGDKTLDDILNNFQNDGVWGIVADVFRSGMGIVIISVFPMQSYSARLANSSLIFGKPRELSTMFHLIFTFVFFVVALAAAIILPSVSVVLGFIGSICSLILMFGFPCMLSIKMAIVSRGKTRFFYICLALLFAGVSIGFCIVGVLASTMRLIDFLHGR